VATSQPWRIPRPGSRVAVTLSPSLGADLLGCQSQYITDEMERETKNETITQGKESYETTGRTTDQFCSMATFRRVMRTGKLHLHWSVLKPMPTPFILGRNPINREVKEMKKQTTMKHPNCFCVLRISTIETPYVYSGGQSGRSQ